MYKCFFPYKYNAKYQHGKNAEPQFAYYATKHEEKLFAKFYFGRVCSQFDYDGFIVAEFLDKNKPQLLKKEIQLKDNCNYLSIIYTETRKIENLINNKIVDFGGILEIMPELKDKKIRYMLNLILKNINFKHEKSLIKYKWNIDAKHIKFIKNGIKKYDNVKDYIKALKIIRKYIIYFPKKLYKDLKNILTLDDNYNYNFEESLCYDTFFDSNVKKILRQLNYFQLKYDYLNCYPEMNMNGYIDVKLFDNLSAVINFNSEKVLNVRFEKKEQNEFIVLLKAQKPEELYESDFIKLIQH